MDGGGVRCGGALPLTPEYKCVVSVGEDGALAHFKRIGGTIVVEDFSRQLKIGVCDRSLRFFKGNQGCNHLCQ